MVARLSGVLLVLLASGLPAQEKKRDHGITLDDYFSLDIILQQQISPSGEHVAYTLTRWDRPSDGRRVDLWCVARESGKMRRLTFDHAGVSSPRWSSDGREVYFLGRLKREGEKQPPLDGTTQVWRVSRDGGEPFAVTRVAGGVQAFDLAPQVAAVYYQTSVEKVDGPFETLRKEFKSIQYGHGVGKTSVIWKLDLETWKAEKVIDDKRVVREFSVSPNGKSIAMITTPDETVVTFEGQSRVEVFDLENKQSGVIPDKCYRADGASPYAWLEHVVWNAKSNGVAFTAVFDGFPAEIIAATGGRDGWRSRKVVRPANVHVRGYGSPLHWAADDVLYFLAEEKGRVRLRQVNPNADRQPVLEEARGDDVVESFSFTGPGSHQHVLLRNGTTHTPDLFVGRTRLTNINPQVDTWKLPKISVFSWKSKDGTDVEGILELPADYNGTDRLPLVVCIHGGPTTADRLHLQYWIYGRTLLPAKGYAVLCPNYRGSTGYGDKFLTDLVGHENERDVEDILAGIDALAEKGIADPDRLGVSGWSNGGYLTNCLITKTTRFKAASSGAGIVDTVMEWGANDEPAYAIAFKKGFPWNQSELYKKTSPTYALDKVRTATLIHVGGSDDRCPPGHSRMLYRALKEYVKVPTELLVYPGEPHGLTKYSNRKAKMEWDLAWFDKYILGKSAK